MSDERLRDLERRWRATGDLALRAALLGERVRAGDLAPDRLALARALGEPALADDAPPVAFDAWLATLPLRRGRPLRGRAALRLGVSDGVSPLERDWVRLPIALGRALAPAARALGVGAVLDDALALAERRLLGHEDLLGSTIAALHDEIEERDGWWDQAPPDVPPLRFASDALLGPSAPDLSRYGPLARATLEPEAGWGVEPALEAALEACFPRSEGRQWGLRLAIRAELLPWALGEADPVAARVAAGEPTGGAA